MAEQRNLPPDASPLNGQVPPKEYRWKPGQSGNPAGRPAAGATVKEWWNQMAGWSEAEIREVLEDDDAPAAKRAAARGWIHAMSQEFSQGGLPIAGPDLDRIIDYTEGKAKQTVDNKASGEVRVVVEYVDPKKRAD